MFSTTNVFASGLERDAAPMWLEAGACSHQIVQHAGESLEFRGRDKKLRRKIVNKIETVKYRFKHLSNYRRHQVITNLIKNPQLQQPVSLKKINRLHHKTNLQ